MRRLNFNEYRFDHHPAVKEAFASAGSSLAEYATEPDADLVRSVATYAGVAPQNVLLAAGSDEALRATLAHCTAKGFKTVIVGLPTYTHFTLFAEQSGLTLRPVVFGLRTTEEERVGLLYLHASEMRKGAVVYLGNPNNPTGDEWDPLVVAKLAAAHPASIFIVDEAYIEFAGMSDASHLVLTHPNVVVTRTFSKAFGLAGLRVGYGLAAPELAAAIATRISPKSVTATAAACAKACLGPGVLPHYLDTAELAVKERGALASDLRANGGWHVKSGGGNFLLVHVGDTAAACATLAAAGVAVRDRNAEPTLQGFIRVSAGSPRDTAATLRAFARLTPPVEPPIQTLHTPKAAIVALRRIFASVVAALAAAEVRWWVCDGTLLGVRRHGGIIPHDADIDVAYTFTPPSLPKDGALDEDPVAYLGGALAKAGLALQRNRTNAYWQVGTNAPGTVISESHVDLFPFHLDKKSGYYLNADPRFRFEAPDSPEAFCNTRYLPGDLFPLTAAPFYEATVPIPARADEVLTRALGPDWRAEAVVRVPGRAPRRCRVVDTTPA